MAEKILIVEDNSELANLLVLHLQEYGYGAEVALDGNSGLKKISFIC